jgi:hypothetical protein
VFSHVWHIYFRDLIGLDRFEVVQTAPDRVRITLAVPEDRHDPTEIARTRATVERGFPGIGFEWQTVPFLAVGPGDKHRAVRSCVHEE